MGNCTGRQRRPGELVHLQELIPQSTRTVLSDKHEEQTKEQAWQKIDLDEEEDPSDLKRKKVFHIR